MWYLQVSQLSHLDMHYLDALSDNLQRVLLVRGSGREVVTMYSWAASKPSNSIQAFDKTSIKYLCECVHIMLNIKPTTAGIINYDDALASSMACGIIDAWRSTHRSQSAPRAS